MSTDEIINQIRALWGPSGATARGISRDTGVAINTVRKVRDGGKINHSLAVAILAAVKALPDVSGVSEEENGA
jgi:hypothetical protein